MIVDQSDRFKQHWLPEALDDVADKGALYGALEKGMQQLATDPRAGVLDGFQSGNVVRRLDLDYAHMALRYEVNPDTLSVVVRAIARPDKLENIAPGVPMSNPAIESEVQRTATFLGTSRDPALLTEASNTARNAMNDALKLGNDDLAVLSARVREEVAIAQGQMLDRSVNKGDMSVASKELEGLMQEEPAKTRIAAREASERARIRSGARDQQWTLEDAIEAQPKHLHRPLGVRLQQKLELDQTRDLKGPGGDVPQRGL